MFLFFQECPTGYVEEDTFRFIFSHFFPYGNASLYAHYVFRTFDQNRNGAITFKKDMMPLDVLLLIKLIFLSDLEGTF
ncbi:hypothetical protein TNCT_135111 [Trichonephila clavata]|uniref:EF-hand domain-containing protein n=1 Tax=Trichonephila clavata TaxID=2740835 RepID=A0A8X6L4U2_TRICU|nr:hypothetical protein TNCT_135111 [Trichonephila clavata]